MHPKTIHNLLGQQFETELRDNILPFWMQHTLDHENGGFYGAVTNDLHVHNQVERSAVICSRILWTFSTAARLYGEETYFHTAQWAFDYLTAFFWDEQFQGIYWSLDRYGRPVNDRKHTYAQAFSIYAFSAYYQATSEPKSLSLAQKQFELLETHTFDPVYGGNIECRARDWSSLADTRLSDKEINSSKSMNTLLHLMEAYASLAQIWSDAILSEKLGGLVKIFLDKIIDSHSGHQHMFFDNHWNSLSNDISFGHDIETSWLLLETAKVLGDPILLDRVRKTGLIMAQAVYQQAFNPDGSILYEITPNEKPKQTRHWWAHAEAVVGFYNAYQLSGQMHFADAADKVWNYIQAFFVDRQNGDWFKQLRSNGQPILSHHKVGPWECPYHHARMCFEMIERL